MNSYLMLSCQTQKIKIGLALSSLATSTQNHCNDYQFLQQSKLPTFYFQQSLPRLPIPKLEKTCERYLAALKPILSDESYQQSANIVNSFRISPGPELQKILLQHDKENKHTSYISKPWFDMYLRDRSPLPINYNPLLMMKHDPRSEYNDQLLRATNMVLSSLRFMNSLRYECLEPEIFHLNPKKSDNDRFKMIMRFIPKAVATYAAYAFKAFPLDMSQYNGLFGATRIPQNDKDCIYRNDKSKHILVILNGNFFSVDVLDESGYIEPPNIILGRLAHVLQDQRQKSQYPLGVLTAWNRNKWAEVRDHIIKIDNKSAMELVDSALFCLCFDDVVYDDSNPEPIIRNFLAGDGTNRWFDKSLSIFIGKDGTTAINFEHSWGDGVAVLRFFNEIYKETTENPQLRPEALQQLNDSAEAIKIINFNLDDYAKQAITQAQKFHNDNLNSLDINILRYSEINKNFCKSENIGPDSIMQLAFQLAYKIKYGEYVGTYESCSTAAFRHGRTETMRPCTIATKEFCDAIISKRDVKLKSLIENCSKIHGNLTKEAAMGQGFDRHLFGLRIMANKYNIKVEDLFNDYGYKKLNNHIISTSTLSSPGLLAGAFGPVVKDGLGIGYNIQNDLCGAIVTSYKGQRDGKGFTDSLKNSFDIIQRSIKMQK